MTSKITPSHSPLLPTRAEDLSPHISMNFQQIYLYSDTLESQGPASKGATAYCWPIQCVLDWLRTIFCCLCFNKNEVEESISVNSAEPLITPQEATEAAETIEPLKTAGEVGEETRSLVDSSDEDENQETELNEDQQRILDAIRQGQLRQVDLSHPDIVDFMQNLPLSHLTPRELALLFPWGIMLTKDKKAKYQELFAHCPTIEVVAALKKGVLGIDVVQRWMDGCLTKLHFGPIHPFVQAVKKEHLEKIRLAECSIGLIEALFPLVSAEEQPEEFASQKERFSVFKGEDVAAAAKANLLQNYHFELFTDEQIAHLDLFELTQYQFIRLMPYDSPQTAIQRFKLFSLENVQAGLRNQAICQDLKRLSQKSQENREEFSLSDEPSDLHTEIPPTTLSGEQQRLLKRIKQQYEDGLESVEPVTQQDLAILPLSHLSPRGIRRLFDRPGTRDPTEMRRQDAQLRQRFAYLPPDEVRAAFNKGIFHDWQTKHLLRYFTKEHLAGIQLASCSREIFTYLFPFVCRDQEESKRLAALNKDRFNIFAPSDVAAAFSVKVINEFDFHLFSPEQVARLDLSKLTFAQFERLFPGDTSQAVSFSLSPPPSEKDRELFAHFPLETIKAAFKNEAILFKMLNLLSLEQIRALKDDIPPLLALALIVNQPWAAARNRDRLLCLGLDSVEKIDAYFPKELHAEVIYKVCSVLGLRYSPADAE